MNQGTAEACAAWKSLAVGFGLVILVMAIFWIVNGLLPRFLRQLRQHRKCEPNVIVGYETYSVVEQWSCGDKICRCGGTKRKGYLDGYQ